jgi:spoIIIJ-associated protein
VTDTPVTDSVVGGDPDAADRPERGEALLVQEGDIAGDYLERLLDIVDFDGDIDLDVEGDRAVVAVIGDGLQGLVGPERSHPRRAPGADPARRASSRPGCAAG